MEDLQSPPPLSVQLIINSFKAETLLLLPFLAGTTLVPNLCEFHSSFTIHLFIQLSSSGRQNYVLPKEAHALVLRAHEYAALNIKGELRLQMELWLLIS